MGREGFKARLNRGGPCTRVIERVTDQAVTTISVCARRSRGRPIQARKLNHRGMEPDAVFHRFDSGTSP
jgi:hypothetical protein